MGIINFWEKYYMMDLVVGNENPQKNIGRTKSGSPITGEVWKQSIQYIKSQIGLKITDDILEVCCGNGMVIGELSKYCNSAKGIDFSEKLINQLNQNSGFQILKDYTEGSAWELGDAIDPPFRDWYDDYTADVYHNLYTKIIHWTGHEDRLARDAIVQKFNSKSSAFSQEHLVGEIGTAYLCMMVELDRNKLIDTPLDYNYEWSKILQQDSSLLFNASKQAFEAIRYIFH